MKDYPSPCETCKHDNDCNRWYKCERWKTRYLYRQEQINAYAKKVLPAYYASLKKGGDGGGSK